MSRTILFVLAGLAVCAGLGEAAYGTSILRYRDLSLGTDVVDGALVSLGLTATLASDIPTFDTLLASQAWDLVIVQHQNEGTAPDVSGYLAGGGKVLAATWLDSTIAAVCDADVVGYNANPVGTDAHAIFAGVGPTMALVNPGWGTFSLALAPLGTAQGLGTLGIGNAVILGNDGRSLLQGPLFDTFADVAQGQLFAANEIEYLLGGVPPIPEPLTVAGLALGLGALGTYLRRRK
jgi:hypothetical protein